MKQACAAMLSAICYWLLLARAESVVVGETGTPVSRVVSLLQQLQEKLEADLKAETQIYKKYACWFTTVKDAKTASNAAANSRISELQQYIADIDAGKFEFTTERKDLEKQIAGLNTDLQTAAALRAKELNDYEAAKLELQQALTALSEAIRVLKEGTSALLAKGSGVQRLSARWSLRKALEFSRAVLSKEDAQLLEGVFARETPTPDWKKLNRDATFKMKYNARSGDIIATLEKLKFTFTGNLNEVEANEREAKKSYDALKTSKEAMLSSSEKALLELNKENGARGVSKSEAQEEVSALQEQVTADEQFIKQVQSAFDTKTNEYNERAKLRQKELTAISEAIALLHSDDARDKFKESFKSQGYSFLQADAVGMQHKGRTSQRQVRLGGRSSGSEPLKDALALLASTASSASAHGGRSRVAMVAELARSMGIPQVIAAIDTLLQALDEEAQEDLGKKESCEADLANNSQEAKTLSRAIDGLTDDMAHLASKVAELQGEVEEQEKAISATNASMLELDRQRADEAKQFAAEKATDSEAVMVLDQALQVLRAMLAEVQPSAKAAALVTSRRHAIKEPYQVTAGETPPPPPATWSNPTYEGASESTGIIGLLDIIKQDMEKDIQLAAVAEQSAVEAHNTAKGELEQAKAAAEDAIQGYNEEKALAEETSIDKETEKTQKKQELDSVMSMIKSLQPGCDYILVNFDIRVKKRYIEVDGLNKAKAILQGASFS